jgi:Ca-activated chloride channel homolog
MEFQILNAMNSRIAIMETKSAKLALLFVCSLFVSVSYAQLPFTTAPEKTETRSGNKQYDKSDYADAEASYKKALDKKNNMPEATFNLGDAVYAQKRFEEAAKQFQLSAQTNTDKNVKAKAYHNLGNAYLEQQKWEDAVKAYKEALKNNPKDADTKYNLAYANAKLREQQQQDQQSKDNKDNKDKKDDKQKENDKKEQENKDKQDQNKDQQAKDQEKKDQQQKQGQQPKLSREEAEKLLQALQGEEQKTNQKMQQKQMKVVQMNIEKDW